MQENVVVILILIALALGGIYTTKKYYWWHVPSKDLIKRNLSGRSDKEIEFRFQEAVRIHVVKSIFVTIFIFFITIVGLMAINPVANMQASASYINVIRDKEEYKKASDTDKEKIIEKDLEKNGLSKNNEFSQQNMNDMGIFFLIPILVLGYMGVLKRNRLSAIYEVVHEREVYKSLHEANTDR